MAVVQKIKDILLPDELSDERPAPLAEATTYKIIPLTEKHTQDVLNLNLRCFHGGENYTLQTFKHLLTEPSVLSYRIITAEEQMVGFIFVTVTNEKVAHITTVGVAPEHRKRGLAKRLLLHAEKALKNRSFDSVVLEVRVGNYIAQNLYHQLGYTIIQKLHNYYSDGEDAYLMSKSIY